MYLYSLSVSIRNYYNLNQYVFFKLKINHEEIFYIWFSQPNRNMCKPKSHILLSVYMRKPQFPELLYHGQINRNNCSGTSIAPETRDKQAGYRCLVLECKHHNQPPMYTLYKTRQVPQIFDDAAFYIVHYGLRFVKFRSVLCDPQNTIAFIEHPSAPSFAVSDFMKRN